MSAETELERKRAYNRRVREAKIAARAGELPAGLEKEPDVYKAMCHVLGAEAAWDVTPVQKGVREWFKSSPGSFMAKYGELQRARQVPEVVEATEEADEGTEKALRHLERFLEGGDVIDGDMASEGAAGEDGERPV